MPKKKQAVCSLKSLCLDYVADNIDSIWATEYMENHQDENHRLDTMAPSPFSKLDDSLVQDLIDLLGSREALSPSAIYSLLVPQLTRLDLSECGPEVNDAIAQVITVRCRNLSSLDLCDCFQISTDTLVDLLKALPGLSKLNLSEMQCNTQVLSTVGSYCKQLRHLEIEECEELSAVSLLYLVYDPISHSFCCQMLEFLEIGPFGPGNNRQHLLWPLVFVLLALPNLKSFYHTVLIEALCVIHDGQFDAAEMPPGFPSLIELASRRMINFPNGEMNRLTLALEERPQVDEYTWPILHAVCPNIMKVYVFLTGRPGLDQSFWSCRHLTDLTIDCRDSMDMRELLPVVATLGPQLEYLKATGFSFTDEFSFHALLAQGQNFQNLNIHFSSPLLDNYGSETNFDAFTWNGSLPPPAFPQLSELVLCYADSNDPFPPRHVALLQECLESLLNHSPCLQNLELNYLPINLDLVFGNVLEPPGTALLKLRRLTLLKSHVSFSTIQRLLFSDNDLCLLQLKYCTISSTEYEDLLQIIRSEFLEVEIQWK